MGWKKLLFSERTPYQLVEIYSTLDFGNVLVLDGFTNLAESDLVYTHSLMCKGVQVRNKLKSKMFCDMVNASVKVLLVVCVTDMSVEERL